MESPCREEPNETKGSREGGFSVSSFSGFGFRVSGQTRLSPASQRESKDFPGTPTPGTADWSVARGFFGRRRGRGGGGEWPAPVVSCAVDGFRARTRVVAGGTGDGARRAMVRALERAGSVGRDRATSRDSRGTARAVWTARVAGDFQDGMRRVGELTVSDRRGTSSVWLRRRGQTDRPRPRTRSRRTRGRSLKTDSRGRETRRGFRAPSTHLRRSHATEVHGG